MHLLFLGLSSIVERRALPAAEGLDAIHTISIASRSRAEPGVQWSKRGRFFTDYAPAIAESGADALYVSLPNNLHEQWAFAGLQAGKHVIVDKPAFLSVEASQRAIAEAKISGLLLAEATVFSWHPHAAALTDFLGEHGPATHIDAHFIIPPLLATNFRNRAELGGGCLNDMGPYAAAVVRLFGDGGGDQLFAIGSRHGGVDTGFSLLVRCGNGALMTGHFSINAEYQNRLLITTRIGSVMVERVFSPPADQPVALRRRLRNTEEIINVEPADSFGRFLDAASATKDSKDFEPFYSDLQADAVFRARIAQSLGMQ